METAARTRQRWTPAQRAEILQNYRSSELTQKQFVAQAGLGLSTLNGWLRKAKRVEAGRSSFVPVPNLLAASASPATYRLQLPRGLSLEVRSGFDAQELGRWLALLRVA